MPYEINGKRPILAAYTCTPLVRIPVSELKPGNKVKGTTIAELGNRNKPARHDCLHQGRQALHPDGQQQPRRHEADRPTNWTATSPITKQTEVTGVPYETIADLKGVQQLDKFDDSNALVLMGDAASLDLRTRAAAVTCVALAPFLYRCAALLRAGRRHPDGWRRFPYEPDPPDGRSLLASTRATATCRRCSAPVRVEARRSSSARVFRSSPGMHVRAVFQPPGARDECRLRHPQSRPARRPLRGPQRLSIRRTDSRKSVEALRLLLRAHAGRRSLDSTSIC